MAYRLTIRAVMLASASLLSPASTLFERAALAQDGLVPPKPVQMAALGAEDMAALDSMADGPIGRPPPLESRRAPKSRETVLLDATVNSSPTGLLLTMQRGEEGEFYAKAGELRSIRILIDRQLGDDEWVSLGALNIVTRYDEASQSIALEAPLNLLETFQVGLGGEGKLTDLTTIKPTPGAILNYSVYGMADRGSTLLSGSHEAILVNRLGAFSSTGAFSMGNSWGGNGYRRLDTSWRLIDPVAVRSYTAGDFASNAFSWGGSVRLAGFQIASAFEQRPDLVTNALPQFSGTAALPSTLDLYVGQQKVYSTEVPAGPFDLKSLPYLSGGEARMVTTDITGRRVEVAKKFYYASGQLKPGLVQYSVDIGIPRLNYGITSFDYDKVLFGSGSVRYGLSGFTTLEGHVEASGDGLANAGVGVVQALGGVASVTGSVSASSYDGHRGVRASLYADAAIGGLRFFAGIERTFGDYFDLGRVSIYRTLKRRPLQGGQFADLVGLTARASAVDRFGLSFVPWFDKTTVSMGYSRLTTDDQTLRTSDLSLSRSLGNGINLYLNGYIDLENTRNYGAFASVGFRFGTNGYVSSGLDNSSGRLGYTMQVSNGTAQSQNSLGWGVSRRDSEGAAAQHSAYVNYRAPFSTIRASVDENRGEFRGAAQVDGSLLVAGGQAYLANRIGQAFAVVENAGPGTEIRQNGVKVAVANQRGNALLPDVLPYMETAVSIDPSTMPAGWEPVATEVTGAAGYRQGTKVDFGARKISGAVVTVQDKAGKPIEPGTVVQLVGGESAVMGYDGQVYLRGLAAANTITLDLGERGTCSLAFAYDVAGAPQPNIGPLKCP